jgi:hypothetical protein
VLIEPTSGVEKIGMTAQAKPANKTREMERKILKMRGMGFSKKEIFKKYAHQPIAAKLASLL